MVRDVRAGTLLVVDQALIKQVFEGITHRLTAHPKLQLQRPLSGQLIAGAAGDNVALLQQTNHLLILRPGHGRQCLSQQARLVGVQGAQPHPPGVWFRCRGGLCLRRGFRWRQSCCRKG